MNTLQLISGFALTGVVITAVAQYTKSFLSHAGHRTLYVVGLSVAGGLIVYFGHLIPENWIADVIGVWAAANSAYIAIKALGIFDATPAAITPVIPDSVPPPPAA